MAQIKQTLEIDAPVHAAYDQWSRFESFPIFMDGIKDVQRRSDNEVFFHAHVQGVDHTWLARVVRNDPDHEISWRSIDGSTNRGRVLFEPLGAYRTQVTLIMEYEPENWKEKLGDVTGLVDRRVKADMQRFKNFIERKTQRNKEAGDL